MSSIVRKSFEGSSLDTLSIERVVIGQWAPWEFLHQCITLRELFHRTFNSLKKILLKSVLQGLLPSKFPFKRHVPIESTSRILCKSSVIYKRPRNVFVISRPFKRHLGEIINQSIWLLGLEVRRLQRFFCFQGTFKETSQNRKTF